TLIELRRYLVGTQESAPVDDIGIGLIEGVADAWRKPRAGFKQGYRSQLPTAQHGVPPTTCIQESAALTDGQLVETGQKEAIATRTFDIAVIAVDIEAVGDGNSVIDFARISGRSITLIVGKIFRQRIVRTEV